MHIVTTEDMIDRRGIGPGNSVIFDCVKELFNWKRIRNIHAIDICFANPRMISHRALNGVKKSLCYNKTCNHLFLFKNWVNIAVKVYMWERESVANYKK